ncbi:hypothetical protein HAX54_019466 [Datura stramonium]|uniref:Uncharacterized protein n=1 Tax=Datura stramonium TaxID=4076 RepID=A0ABS8UR95_DATST|nr:hypothetical protein [Datura stramonium]
MLPDNLMDYVQMLEDYGINDNDDEEIELDNNDTPPTPNGGVGPTKFTRGEGQGEEVRPEEANPSTTCHQFQIAGGRFSGRGPIPLPASEKKKKNSCRLISELQI